MLFTLVCHFFLNKQTTSDLTHGLLFCLARTSFLFLEDLNDLYISMSILVTKIEICHFSEFVIILSPQNSTSPQNSFFLEDLHDLQLVGGFKHFFNFSIIYGIILPVDFHIFQDG